MRPRFSLRLFLIVFTLIAVALGGAAQFAYRIKDQVRRHKAAVAKLRELDCHIYETEYGAEVAPKWAFEAFARRWIDRSYGAEAGACNAGRVLSSQELHQMAKLMQDVQGIDSIEIMAQQVDPQTVRQLAVHPGLRYLYLRVARLKPNANWRLDDFKKLEYLQVMCPMDAQLAEAISRIPHLEHLDVDATVLSEAGVQAICSGPQLQTISIRNGRFSNAAASAIRDGRGVKTVSLERTTVDADALSTLAKSAQLKQVMLDECVLPRRSIETLTCCPSLKMLWLRPSQSLAEFDLESLTNLTHLEELDIAGVALTSADFERIHPPQSLNTFEYEGDINEALLQRFLARAPKCEIDQRVTKDQQASYHGKRLHLKDGKLICKEYTYADCGVMPP